MLLLSLIIPFLGRLGRGLRQRSYRPSYFELGFGNLGYFCYHFVHCCHCGYFQSLSYSYFPDLSSGLCLCRSCLSRWRMLFVLVIPLLLLVLSTFLQTVLQASTRFLCSTFVVVK